MNTKETSLSYTPEEVCLFFERLKEKYPNPQTELYYTNPYTLLVAVVLSAQSTDKGVNKVTKSLFARIDTPEKMCALGQAQLEEALKSLGLYRNKARHVIKLSEQLITTFNGRLPETRARLQTLAGVGRKTANVVLNVVFGQPTIPVDTHIFRLGNRIGFAPGKTPLEVEKALERIIPEDYRHGAHHWLILHGRYTCKARKPLCDHCLVSDICKSAENWAPLKTH